MSDTNCEKLVKYTLKSISKKYGIDYEELKSVLKKVVKLARNYDESILGMMEEIMDLGNVGAIEELDDFSIEVLRVYCRIKEIDTDGISDRHIRSRVWKNIESEFELDDEDDEDDEDESEYDDEDSEEEDSESEEEEEQEPVKKSSKNKHHSSSKKKSSDTPKNTAIVEEEETVIE